MHFCHDIMQYCEFKAFLIISVHFPALIAVQYMFALPSFTITWLAFIGIVHNLKTIMSLKTVLGYTLF